MSIKKSCVVGTNVSTSLSPTIFNYWFNKYNVNGEYSYEEIEEDSFDKKIKSILKEDRLCGLNVTIPFKKKIIPYLTTIDTESNKIEAVNCVTKKDNSFKGTNTDWIGFKEAYYSQKPTQTNPEEFKKKAIVLGYGGAARAIIYFLVHDGWNKIIVCNRTFDKIKNIDKIIYQDNIQTIKSNMPHSKKEKDVQFFTKKHHHTIVEVIELKDLYKHTNTANLIINTTPVNILNSSNKWNISPHCEGFDVVYKPRGGTGFLNHFNPINRIEGIYMLIQQAVPCFYEWYGINPKIDKNLLKVLFKKMDEIK